MCFLDFAIPDDTFKGSFELWRIVYTSPSSVGFKGPQELVRLKAYIVCSNGTYTARPVSMLSGWKPSGYSFQGFFPVEYNKEITYFKEAIDDFELYVKNWCEDRNGWAIEM